MTSPTFTTVASDQLLTVAGGLGIAAKAKAQGLDWKLLQRDLGSFNARNYVNGK